MINIPYINEAGSMDPKKGYQEISGIIVKFFSETLGLDKQACKQKGHNPKP